VAGLFQMLLLGLPLFLFFTPRRGYGWVLAVLVLAVGWIWWEINRPISMSDDWAPLGRMLATGAMLLWLAAYALRMGIDWIVGFKFPRDAIDYRPFRVALAICITAWAGWLLGPPLARWLGGWPVLLGGVAAASFLLLLGRRADRGQWIFLGTGLTILAGVAGILSWPSAVASAAAARAAGQPYCIMIGDGDGDYRPARNMLDLSPLVMRANESPYLRNQHALLIFRGGGGLHFSYRRGQFERGHEGDEYVDHPLCTPRHDFAGALPVW